MAAAPGLQTLTAAGGNPLAPATPNGVPITAAASGLNVAAQAQAAINAAAAVSASALHHNPAVLSHTNHQLSVHPAISPHLPQHHIAAAVTAAGQQQLSSHLNCHFTNAAAVDGGGHHPVSNVVATNSLQHRQHSSQTNHSQKNNLLQHSSSVHQVTSNPSLLHQTSLQQSSSAQQQPNVVGQPSLQTLVGHTSATGYQPTTKQLQTSPAPKKFRPSYTRPSNKHTRYVPKPMPQELSNLKTYSKDQIILFIK